ncbi:uncharacterized protein BX663DRAFT_493073 [Cokeromyces recurvatus]|uniref:uncharacterized protein n=1 Tax=Cokeromyces recurvatus TaxID=90255 RepID=UPI00221FA4D7|nr:uncharacterized protein BX663DRAFT_493073 [Cokeromyces recurvatus]KAI7908129.1 hypothetical protein BX663DRAFT_493073 [Cokeromyces recurvatus]
MDSNLDVTVFSKEKSFPASLMDYQSSIMRGLLFMMIISHLVVPILPPSLLPADFLSTLVSLSQAKSNMHTHLAQYQSSCWKYWNISVPNALFEKKENERSNSTLMGWWGPAKGVPILVFIITDVPFSNIIPTAIKRMQDALQTKVKNMFRALHLMPSRPEGSTHHLPVEVRSLFLLPSGSQPVIHIIPAPTKEINESMESDLLLFNFDKPPSLASSIQDLLSTSETNLPSVTLYHEYSDKLLKNFVTIWTKTAIYRHPLHHHHHHHTNMGRKLASQNDDNFKATSTPLPTPMQFASAVVPLLSFLFNKPITENGVDFKKIITTQFPSTKGMIQQIEVILRKKIKDNIEIERVFSKSHCMEIMQKCNEVYLQDSPPYYAEKYHEWKKNNVIRMYYSLARGPCKEEYAVRLQRDCDAVWKGGRQSCEHVSLTGKTCRLKIDHELDTTFSKSARDERSSMIDTAKHNSGITFFHACNCGKSQRVRDDPFEVEDANIRFYNKFDCCLIPGRAALDICKSKYGEKQDLVLNYDEIPAYDISLLYLGPASFYKNNIGLDKVEGFTSNTNFLIPWSMTTTSEIKLRQQEMANADTTSQQQDKAPSSSSATAQDNNTEWPLLGKSPPSTLKPAPTPITVAPLDVFPALGSNLPSTHTPTLSTPTTITMPNTSNRQLFDTRRRRYHRGRERLQGLVRGYVGAEYECPFGHRFLSCGDGRVCKLGHKGHPKEHGNYFVHQDLPVYIICPCTYANNTSNSNSSSSSSNNNNNNNSLSNNAISSNSHMILGHSSVTVAAATAAATTNGSSHHLEVIAQLQRLYVVTPDEPAITISIEPKIKIHVSGKEEDFHILDLGISDSLALGPNSTYVVRLPFIYRDNNGSPIPVELDVQKRLKSAFLQKDCIKFHYKESTKWSISTAI